MKGHKGYHHTHGTASKIEAEVRKHRASGGKAESPSSGDDDAEKDLKDKPERYTGGKPASEAEEMHAKRGGKMKKKDGGKIEGKEASHHAGRKRRASGGGCESNPFTTALKGTGPRAGKTERETDGRND